MYQEKSIKRPDSFTKRTVKKTAKEFGYEEAYIRLIIKHFFLSLKMIIQKNRWAQVKGFFKLEMTRRTFMRNLMNDKLEVPKHIRENYIKNRREKFLKK